MPALTYTSTGFPFVPFTKILSADVNQCFVDIRTLLNITKLDDTNLQDNGITRATKLKTGSANHVIINDGTGAMSSEAQLSTSRGGTGQSFTLSVADVDKVISVNNLGTGFQLSVVPTPPSIKVFNYFRFQ